MQTAGMVVAGLIALLHVYILILEMFLWDKPRGMKAFNLTPESAKATKVLAANQGLYNGFLAAGLFWGLSQGSAGKAIVTFFLLCVAVAGVYGAATSAKKILYIQTVPAVIALAMIWIG